MTAERSALSQQVTTRLQGTDTTAQHLDFCKASDKIPHKRILKSLLGYEIRGNIHAQMKDLLTIRTQPVKINGVSSEPVKVPRGVPQGSVLGTILFLIYINDLPDTIAAIVKIFVDDAKTYQSSSTVERDENVREVQNIVDQSEFGQNFGKCHFI